MRHIEASRLFAFAEGKGDLHEVQREHLNKCKDCQKVLAVFQTYLADSKASRGSKGGAKGCGSS